LLGHFDVGAKIIFFIHFELLALICEQRRMHDFLEHEHLVAKATSRKHDAILREVAVRLDVLDLLEANLY
jgi:hypothetical protein